MRLMPLILALLGCPLAGFACLQPFNLARLPAGNAAAANGVTVSVTAARYHISTPPEIGGGQDGNAPGADTVDSASATVYLPKAVETTSADLDYDQAGRLLHTSLWSYSWDAEDRLTSAESKIAFADGLFRKIECAYDHAGRRLLKQSYTKPAEGSWTLVRQHSYYYDTALTDGSSADFGLLVSEKIEDGASTTLADFEYIWGLDLDGSYQGLGGVGGLLAAVDHHSGKTFLPCSDAKGTIHAWVDAATGKAVAKFAYDPYGRVISSDISGLQSEIPELKFQSKYTDPETGLVFFGFRYYDPSTGRWLSADPLQEAGGLNLYAFCSGDPINGIDYLGMASWWWEDLWVAAKNPLKVGGAFAEGYKAGGAVAANALSFGVVYSESAEVYREYKGTGATKVLATVGREGLITAATLGTAQIARGSIQGTAYSVRAINYLHGVEKVRQAAQVVSVGVVAADVATGGYQVGSGVNKVVAEDDNWGYLDIAAGGLRLGGGFLGARELGRGSKVGAGPSDSPDWKVAPHGEMPTPRPPGFQSHHGVNSVWAKDNVNGYIADNAPAILMKNNPYHNATRAVFNRINAEIARIQGVSSRNVDWSKVSHGSAWRLAEEQLEAAHVPNAVREAYFRAFIEYIDKLR